MKLFLIFSLILFGGCKKISLPFLSQPSSQEAPPKPVSLTSKTRLPFDHKIQDPIFLNWISFLTEARLAFFPNLRSSCQDGRNLLIKFSFSADTFDCSDLVVRNNLDSKWRCLSAEQIQHTLDTTTSLNRCENLSQFLELARSIHLPSENSLYKVKDAQTLTPSTRFQSSDMDQKLPDLILSQEAQPDDQFLNLHFPSSSEWLESSFDSGAIAFVLEIDPKGLEDSALEYSFFHLVRFVAQQREPSKLRFFLNPSTVSPPKRKEQRKLPFFTLKSPPETLPIFKDSCNYINQWLKSRQILAGIDPAHHPIQNLTCHFEWGEKSIRSKNSLTLAKLPLPLIFEAGVGSRIFPFRNLQDTLSPSVFRSLKKP